MDDSMDVLAALALVSSCLYYVNSILCGSPPKHTALVQHTHNTLAGAVTRQRSHASPLWSAELLKQLHWLPTEWCIRFKLPTLTYKPLHTGRPRYLADHLQHHKPTKWMRSRAFRVSAPRLWNLLPFNLPQSQALSSFRHLVKTHYFQSGYPALPMCLDSLWDWCYINHLHTYLYYITYRKSNICWNSRTANSTDFGFSLTEFHCLHIYIHIQHSHIHYTYTDVFKQMPSTDNSFTFSDWIPERIRRSSCIWPPTPSSRPRWTNSVRM